MASVATGSLRLGKRERFAPGSKFIELVEYDPDARTMEITFKSGSKYRYLQVYPTTFLSFKGSPTFDSYYARAIKGNLQSTKIIDQGIGRERSMPLDKVTKEYDLDAGLTKQQNRQKRIYGTVDRAFGTT